MKRSVFSILLMGVFFFLSSCIKQNENPIQIQDKKTEHYKTCGKNSHLISSLEIPYGTDMSALDPIISLYVNMMKNENNTYYIRVSHQIESMNYKIQFIKYTSNYPAHQPNTDKTLYEGGDAQNMALTVTVAWLINWECHPIEFFNWEGVWYVEDCC